ncbi:hypothetical protein V8D89_002032 [Ganoderma adspersum]
MQEFIKILDANTDIAPIVQSLTLKGVPSSRPTNRTQQQDWDDPAGTLRLWERLPNLRILKFEFLRFDKGLHQLLPVAYALPHLEEIAVIDSRAVLPRECKIRPPYRDSLIVLDRDAPGPKLKRLTATGGPISWPFLEDLARVLLEPGMHAPLDTLDLSCITRSNNFKLATWDHTDTLPSQAWAPVVAALGPTLRHCTLGLLAAECFPANLANLYRSLQRCTRLQTLEILCSVVVHPREGTGYSPFIFLDILADTLSPCPPRSGSPVTAPLNFPELSTLSIAWRRTREPVPPVCADACGKLARALDDRSRYHDQVLERLDVTVRADWRGRGSRGAHEKEVAAQEPVLRSFFERVVTGGTQLRVDLAVDFSGKL